MTEKVPETGKPNHKQTRREPSDMLIYRQR